MTFDPEISEWDNPIPLQDIGHDQSPETPLKEILSIDRINPNKGYSPENCRWISFSENAKRVNHKKHANQR